MQAAQEALGWSQSHSTKHRKIIRAAMNPHIAPIYGGRPLASLADDIERIHAKFNKNGKVEARPAAEAIDAVTQECV